MREICDLSRNNLQIGLSDLAFLSDIFTHPRIIMCTVLSYLPIWNNHKLIHSYLFINRHPHSYNFS